MTHSGQGDEQRPPAARPAHEGVVLPADGQEPVIPGPSGAQAAPAGGQPWGAPWGPQQPPEGQDPAGGHGAAPGPPSGEAPPGAQAPGYGYPSVPGGQGPGASYGGAPVPGAGYGSAQAPHGQGHGYPPGPGAQVPGHGHPSPPGAQAPGYGYPSVPGGQGPGASYGGAPVPGAGYGSAQAPHGQGHGYPPGPGAQSAAPPYGAHGTPAQPLPPQNGPGPHAAAPGAAPAADAEQTRLLPPQGGRAAPAPGGAEDATQYLAPVPPAPPGAGDATQYLAPVPGDAGQPGALPPESPAESTTFLGTKAPARHGAPHRAAPAPGGAEDATQYLAPVPSAPSAPPFGIRPGAPGDRPPPAEFDSLFRADAPGAAGADSTRQLPRYDAGPAAPPRPAGPGGGQEPPHGSPPYDPPGRGDGRSGARRSVVPVVAAVVVGCAVLGLGVGAVLFSGGDEGPAPAAAATVAAESPRSTAPEPPEPDEDPAEEQAEALDELLADSNDSRAAVIRSVENIKKCTELDQAAADLKDAAEQRRGLVTRLDGLAVDELPDHARLTAALTEAWQASASADDHYAAWAKQVKGKRGCKDGQARTTSHTAQGNRASGEATRAKDEAAALWNAIAREHGLTERQSTQL
ncbi:hypothetical protein NPS70_11605 [Streptomyces sp. C10-9-1]|uniref:hypothetical protein n=1 Tax=Streptomyces sp. C10-9-1 TaxID=1859285 RepID=UPI00211113B9|nr:hypothetical protein [Streptomyces sp. C10-9-1]MCQ6553835.1 hypothetical protein [Streptomyces sp. C10-9-1]